MLSKNYTLKNIISFALIAYSFGYSAAGYAIAYIPGGKDFISNRLVNNDVNGEKYVSKGAALNGIGPGFEGFINVAQRGQSPSLSGYKVTTTGMVLSSDYLLNESFAIGLAFTYAKSNVRTAEIPSNYNKVATYNGVVLFSLMPEQTFLDVYLTAGRNQYHLRDMLTPVIQAKSKTSAKQSGVRTVIGHNILGSYDSSASLAPILSIDYLSIAKYSYTASANGVSQNFSQPKTRKMEVGIGIEAASESKGDYSNLITQFHFMLLRDWADKRHISLGNFSLAQGGFKSVAAHPKRMTYNIGFAMTLSSSERLFVTAKYDFALQSKLKSHTAGFQLKYIF